MLSVVNTDGSTESDFVPALEQFLGSVANDSRPPSRLSVGLACPDVHFICDRNNGAFDRGK
ncbi:hypothetical protein ACWD0A_00020 [Streptomyces sp. NPDC002867]